MRGSLPRQPLREIFGPSLLSSCNVPGTSPAGAPEAAKRRKIPDGAARCTETPPGIPPVATSHTSFASHCPFYSFIYYGLNGFRSAMCTLTISFPSAVSRVYIKTDSFYQILTDLWYFGTNFAGTLCTANDKTV